MNKKTFPLFIVHLLFCLIVVFFFRNNSFLRPTASGALYKEYITGLIALTVCYLNYFVFYPKLYMERRYIRYIFVTIVCLITASMVEEILVYKQILEIVRDLNIDLRLYFVDQTIMILLRDSCFFLFSFMVCTIRTLYGDKHDIYQFLRDKNHLVVAKTLKNETATLQISEISYCQQIENYTYIYLINGTPYTKNCTMSVLADDLGPDCSVRISRNIIVMYAYIQSFDQNTVFVQTHKGIEGFKITNFYKEQTLSHLMSHVIGSRVNRSNVVNVKKSTVNTFAESYQENHNFEQILPIEETGHVEEPEAAQQVLSFISEHPGCKSSDLTGQFHISLSTVNRILRQLKAEGLIAYEGSKKTGGYKAVSS